MSKELERLKVSLQGLIDDNKELLEEASTEDKVMFLLGYKDALLDVLDAIKFITLSEARGE